jgi:hypothetical protein
MRKGVIALLLLAACSFLAAQQVMNNDAVIKLVKAGLSDDLIVATINASPGAYDVSADAIIALKGAGAGDKVIAAVLAKSATPAPASTAPSTAAVPEPPTTGPSGPADTGTASGSAPISAGSRIVIAPMGGFETYFAAAVREKKVPITLTLDKASAQFFVVSTDTEWQGFVYGSSGAANWNRAGGAAGFGAGASSTRGLEASIMVIDAKSKDVVWAYEVHKNSHGSILFGTLGARGEQSVAEACAKHLKEYIETGK